MSCSCSCCIKPCIRTDPYIRNESNLLFCSVCNEYLPFQFASKEVIKCTACGFLKSFRLSKNKKARFINYFNPPKPNQHCVMCENPIVFNYAYYPYLIDEIEYDCLDETSPTCNRCHNKICVGSDHDVCLLTNIIAPIVKIHSKL